MIELTVRTDVPPMTFGTFCLTHAPYSVALDGYVAGGPDFMLKDDGPRANFNHHEEVDRLATRATCGQVLMAIRQGLFDVFRDDGGPRLTAYVNDCDEDVCTTWFLLKHHCLVQSTMNPSLNRLVAMEDALDSTAGAYPFPADLPMLGELNWVFEPYREFRTNGGLSRRNVKEFAGVIQLVEHRIMQHITGAGRSVPLDTRYERLLEGKGWTMVREVGANARTGMFSSGIKAYVGVRERGDGRYTYTVGRMSPFVPFHVGSLLGCLDLLETARRGSPSDDRWGGSDMVGGSPRVSGSVLKPEEVRDAIDGFLRESASGPKR